MRKLLGVAAALVIALTALASAGQPASATGGQLTSATTVIDSRTARLTIWHSLGVGSSEEQVFNTVLASVRPRFPHVTFTVVRQAFPDIYTRFEADPAHGPDLFVAPSDRIAVEASAGLLTNVTTAMKARAATLTPQAGAGARLAGRYYVIPETTTVLALVSRSSRVPTVPATTGALLDAVRGGTKLGFVADGYFVGGLFAAFGGRIIDATYRCVADQSPGVADALDYLRQLQVAGASVYTIDRYSRMQNDFNGGTLDVVIDGNWMGVDFRKQLGADLQVTPLPAGPVGVSRPFVGVDGWFVNTMRPNAPLATKVALAMSDKAAQTLGMNNAGYIPADSTIRVTDPLAARFATAATTGMLRPIGKAFGAFWLPFRTAIETVVMDGADATAAVKAACSAMNATNGK